MAAKLAEQAFISIAEGLTKEIVNQLATLLEDETDKDTDALVSAVEKWQKMLKHPVSGAFAGLLLTQLKALKQGACHAATETEYQKLTPFFPQLVSELTEQTTARDRLQTALSHYPQALLSVDSPLVSLTTAADKTVHQRSGDNDAVTAEQRFLLAILTRGIKAGTDAVKTVTETWLYSDIATRLENIFSRTQESSGYVPYSKSSLITLSLDCTAHR